jgi:hypothetical protein
MKPGQLALSLVHHPHEHRPERPVLLAVDEELGDRGVRGS